MFSAIQNWFKSKGGFSHVVAALFVGAVAAYAAVPAFSSLVNSIYSAMPSWLHEVSAAVIALALWYKNTQSGSINSPTSGTSTKIVAVILGILLVPGFIGCKAANAKLPPGAINSFDAQSYQSLMVAQATLNTLKLDEPTIVVSVPQFKTILNQAIADYNAAEAAWKTYHNTGGNSTAVESALAVLATDILKIQGVIPSTGGKK